MWSISIVHLFAIVLSILLTVLIFIQVRRLWRIKTNLQKFLFDLQSLNENLQLVMKGVKKTSEMQILKDSIKKHVCKYCENRVTFIDPHSPDLFFYKCKLNSVDIELTDTCEKFKKDLQRYRI